MNSHYFDPVSNQIWSPDELADLVEFGTIETYSDGEKVFQSGERNVPFAFIDEGSLSIIERHTDGDLLLTTHGAGEFAGDLNLLMGRPAIADGLAKGNLRVIRIDRAGMLRVFIRHSDLGDRIIDVLQRRRMLLEAGDFRGVRVFGPAGDPDTLRTRDFLYRNGVGHTWVDTKEAVNQEQTRALGVKDDAFPVLACGLAEPKVRPSLLELGHAAGILPELEREDFDCVIIGGGPAGLSATVNAASEGLQTLLLDRFGPGGQAGTSSKIENYAGFPKGVSGRELAMLSLLQAVKFGAEIASPCEVLTVEAENEYLRIRTKPDLKIRTRTLIVATGVTYNPLPVKRLADFRGKGVYYSATMVEAVLCEGVPVHVIGAGNSAGQAAMFLSRWASCVHLIVRGDNLEKSMSSYLSSRVVVNPKIQVHYRTELAAVDGEDRLEHIELRDNRSDQREQSESGGVFVFIGAKPQTSFLGSTVVRDGKGFLMTGEQVLEQGWPAADRSPCQLETSHPAIFAAGDCRSGTTKRVAFAIGDGALAVNCVHDMLGTYR